MDLFKGIAPFRTLKNIFGDQVPGPMPLPFIGNMLDSLRHKGLMHIQLDEYYKKYGDVFGMFLFGSYPTLVVADLEMVKQVYVKDFQAFHDRPVLFKFPEPLDKMLAVVEGDEWKRIRNTLTPTFSAHKMKQMVPLMNSACDILMKKFEEISSTGETFDILSYFQGLTMDVILRCAFGIQADSQNNPDEPAITAAKRAINGSASQRAIITILSLLPFGDKIINAFPRILARNMEEMLGISKQIIAVKKSAESNASRKDLLDLMLIAAQDETLPKTKRLTDAEVLAQSVVFLIAGYETSSTTLGFVAYFLATNPDVQAKLQKEIDSVWDDESKMPSYETVNGLPYLDMVISETLRIYPPAVAIHRTCTENCLLKGLKVPKGLVVTIPLYSLHMDPKVWPQPDKFDPERFTPEAKQSRDPYVYMPFGHGPHNCIGIRFAHMEMKLVLARILKKYSFQTAQDTKIPPEVIIRATLVAKEIKLKITKRE
ncbi:cytochrome P450 3A8-like isoform X2 [Montipora capricornis]|uniref:cytochrome P450 3A8-like isoform X2 n=1 Tax=Montipora capricornis TaxID=246305 RepID=UPI0035F19806